MTMENKEKILKTIQIIANAVIAIAALWLAVSCTLSMSIQKNNSSSNQHTEQVNHVDSNKISVPRETIETLKTLEYGKE